METYNLAILTKRIYGSGLPLFTLKTLKDILAIKKESTLFSVVKRLVKAGVLLKLEKNKYLLKDAKVSDFALANFLYQPSYISFESALNFYGILSQFPYEISSATTKKTAKKKFEGKIFTYTEIKKDLFWGYEKKDNFIIALPEKTLLDQLYLSAKGYKKINLDEYELKGLRLSRLKEYLNKYPKTRQFKNAAKLLKKYINI
jgi:predicted transcriptional regulator of viral defense system